MNKRLPVFGYGSLLWNPGFEPAKSGHGQIRGFRRSFCMRSVHHRGTPERPGLVLALDSMPGATCDGIVLWIKAAEHDGVLAAIRDRELVTSAYRESVVEVGLRGGGRTDAIAYLVDQHHHQYCGELPPAVQARIIAGAAGSSGNNRDYLRQSVQRLGELGILDSGLAEIERLTEELSSRRADR